MARLYANANFPLPATLELRRLGQDVLTMADAGQAGQRLSDEGVLAYAVTNGRAVLTLNRRHFVRLHMESPAHAGIVVCTYDPDFAGLALRIDAAVRDTVLDGRLIRINRAPR